MKLFKSRLRKKIESKQRDLNREILKVQEEKMNLSQTLKPPEYCRLLVKEAALKGDLNLLTEMLST